MLKKPYYGSHSSSSLATVPVRIMNNDREFDKKEAKTLKGFLSIRIALDSNYSHTVRP